MNNNPPKPTPTTTNTVPQPRPELQPATHLLDEEIARREGLAARGRIQTGCHTLDEQVLLGGLERGSVVGVSVEEEEGRVGLAIGLQTVAGLLAAVPTARVMVVTTLPVAGLLPKLRAALIGRLTLSMPREGMQGLQSEVKGCLERISIARVFDVEGLWEVLRELEEAVAVAKGPPPQPAQQTDNKPEDASPNPAKEQRQERTEVLDSEDEGGLSSPESPPPPTSPPRQKTTAPEQANPSTLPDMILITHTSTLLNTLFTGRDKETAHNTTQLLATHLRTLTRSPSHGGPLVMLLNSTTSPYAHPNDTTATNTAPPTDSDRAPKQLDPTLRSIFNPPPAPQPGHVYALAAARRSKPSFGLVFSQMLDVHLLCTRIPRTRGDIAALVANPGVVMEGSYVWVVEVLLDEVGVYREREAGGGRDWGERRCREQRWGTVDVDGEGRVVEAVFE